MRPQILILAAVAILLSPLYAQSHPDADALVRGADDLSRFESVRMDTRETSEVSRPGRARPSVSTTVTRLVLARPDRSRREITTESATLLTVSDGANTLLYDATQKRYTRVAGASAAPALGSDADEMTSGHTVNRILRSESIAIDGRPHACWVVEINFDGAVVSMPEAGVPETTTDGTETVWIDKTLLLRLQSEARVLTKVAGKETATVKTKTTTESLQINEPVPASTFDITPPANATEVSAKSFLSSAGGLMTQALTGQPAPSFELKGVDGVSYRLADLQGRVVILDFWATWCAPCRASIPTIDDFYRKNKDRGVVVLGVNVGEEAEVVSRFVKDKGVHYPVVLSTGSDVVSSYNVSVYPTLVVIGRDGKVTACKFGFPGAGALKKLLSNATKN